MYDYIVAFWCDGDEADAIELASYGMEGYPEMITDVHTGKAHYIPRKGV